MRTWLSLTTALLLLLIIVGGFVRLTRSGLSIVEWNIVTGVLPPLSDQSWQREFEKYQQSPEYNQINFTVDVTQYRQIYFIEYFHRLLARLAGLVFVLPLGYFLATRKIALKKAGIYFLIGLLFAFQGFLGWYMVQSGLSEIPAVSHYRLTAHLLTALFILGLTHWANLSLTDPVPNTSTIRFTPSKFTLGWLMLLLVVIQISYGGFVAGLKAGHISNTWPLMSGKLIPPALLSGLQPWWLNLLANPSTIHFIHRWFAIVVLLGAIWTYRNTRLSPTLLALRRPSLNLLAAIGLQIIIGVSVILFNVNINLALIHQAVGLVVFLLVLQLIHHSGKIRSSDPTSPASH